MDLTDPKLQQQFLEIVRMATDDLRADIKGLQTDFKDMQTDLKGVRTDVSDLQTDSGNMRDDIAQIKNVQGQQSIMLRTTQADVNSLKNSYRQQAKEVTRLGVLFEDLEHRFEASAELN